MYSLGLDFGTNSVRALVVRTTDGAEIGTHVTDYDRGDAGILLDPREPELARQHPTDYLSSMVNAVRGAVAVARSSDPGFAIERLMGIGVDATGSTPLPVDSKGRALAESPVFRMDLNAMAWLWKDHTSTVEAAAITEAAGARHPEYLAKCGGRYSSEWFWSKIWRCATVAPHVANAAHSWVELSDWIPAILTGSEAQPARNACAAGHKGMFHPDWNGFPDREFLASLHPHLGEVRERMAGANVAAIDGIAGRLTEEWATRLGLSPGVPVAIGGIDAHLGAVGSGIQPGILVKILGTSTCDIMVHPLPGDAIPARGLPDIPGLCGIAHESVLPGHYGLEAGQSAVGDIFHWFVSKCAPLGATHESLTREAATIRPGASGLLALDWHNGNRTVLADYRLTGLLIGQTLATRPAEIYRALIEATAFGARVIMDRLAEFGVRVDRVINCGGIAEKSPLVMQIYADVTARPMQISRSAQTCALGAAIAGAVAGGLHPSLTAAQAAMTGVKSSSYSPDPLAVPVYEELYRLYKMLHDAFGGVTSRGDLELGKVMKQLLDIRDRVRGQGTSSKA